jgi:prepilin-type N-terminal cleavage/methylation domain-containing protein
MSARARDTGGFTLVELLVAMSVASIVLVAAGLAFQFASGTLASGSDQADVQQNARWVLERMVQEIRGAGYDPRATLGGSAFTALASQTATSLVLQSDYNGNGLIEAPAGPCDVTATTEKVGYRLVSNELRRATDAPTNACESPIVNGVTALTFSYYDADGNVTAIASAIRTVEIALTLNSTTGGVERKATVADRVRLRNR